MKTLGIIFSNAETESLYEITRKRSTASIPFGGRYRLIDFALSDMVEAGITNVAVLAQKNYQSLMDHLGSGKDWDLSRKNGGLVIFPPFSSYKSDNMSSSRLELLKSIKSYIQKQNPEVVILTDSDSVNAVNISEALKQHEERHADVTIVYKKQTVTKDLRNNLNLQLDANKRIIAASLVTNTAKSGNVSLNITIISRPVLIGLLEDAISRGLSSFYNEVIYPNINSLRVYGYEYKGVYMHISNMENYFKSNMELLDPKVRKAVFEQENHGVYTKVRDSAPTKYGEKVYVDNSFIADGCVIEGNVVNCILFRGVKVGPGSKIKNCILMQDTVVGSNVKLDSVITDKNVIISDRANLAGCEKLPYYISKGSRL